MENLREINCRQIFRKAYENRYTWRDDFKGYQGRCIFSINNDIYKGDFVLGKDFKPDIQNIEDEKVNSVIDAIAEAAKTGEIGDGKIFITSIDSVVRIRTGDKDEEAL